MEKDIHDLVVSHPFTPVTGKPTWDDHERFEKEQNDIALKVKNTYKWSKRHGMIREVMIDKDYLVECDDVDKADMVENLEPPHMPEGFGDMTGNQLKTAEAALVIHKCNWAKLQGFHSGFAENFMKAFPRKYWSKLKQGKVLQWSGRVPMDFIKKFERHIPLDEVQIQRQKDKVLRGWEEEDVDSFGSRLQEERDSLRRMTPPIEISDVDLNIHYMNEIWKRTDIYGERIMEEWTNHDPDQKT